MRRAVRRASSRRTVGGAVTVASDRTPGSRFVAGVGRERRVLRACSLNHRRGESTTAVGSASTRVPDGDRDAETEDGEVARGRQILAAPHVNGGGERHDEGEARRGERREQREGA